MLMMSREVGASVYIDSGNESVVTVLSLSPEYGSVSMLINQAIAKRPGRLESRAIAKRPGRLESRTIAARVGARVDVDDEVGLTLVDIRNGFARIGIEAPPQVSVHRMEVYEAILDQSRGREGQDGSEGGPSDSPVPRAPKPLPPSLDVRLKEPRSGDGDNHPPR